MSKAIFMKRAGLNRRALSVSTGSGEETGCRKRGCPCERSEKSSDCIHWAEATPDRPQLRDRPEHGFGVHQGRPKRRPPLAGHRRLGRSRVAGDTGAGRHTGIADTNSAVYLSRTLPASTRSSSSTNISRCNWSGRSTGASIRTATATAASVSCISDGGSKQEVVLRQEHRAGEKLFVDYAGATIADSGSGSRRNPAGAAIRRRARRQQLHVRRSNLDTGPGRLDRLAHARV